MSELLFDNIVNQMTPLLTESQQEAWQKHYVKMCNDMVFVAPEMFVSWKLAKLKRFLSLHLAVPGILSLYEQIDD